MKTIVPLAVSEDSSVILTAGVSATFVAILKTAVLRMIPYAVPGLMLVLIDLYYGVRAAQKRGEKVRASTAIRRTLTKIFLYIAWLVLATTIALAFEKAALEWIVLGLVYGNEFLSVIGNYFESKGMSFSIVAVYHWLLKFFAGKFGGNMSDDEAGQIIKKKNTKK